jgi:hypothetical protein
MKKIIFLSIALLNSYRIFGQTTVGCSDLTFPDPVVSTYYPIYSDTITQNQALELVNNYKYVTLAQVDASIGYFLFDAGSLLTYLQYLSLGQDGTSDNQIQDMLFVLGNNYSGLTLTIAGVNTDMDNFIYYNGGYVLSNPHPGSLQDNIEKIGNIPSPPSTSTSGPIDICGHYFQNSNLLSTESVFTRYQNAPTSITSSSSEPVTSFLFDAGKLADYIYNTNGIQNVAVMFGMDGSLRLLIMGIDKNGNPVYRQNGGVSYVLEHCYPCPADCPGVALFSIAEKSALKFAIGNKHGHISYSNKKISNNKKIDFHKIVFTK